MKTLHSYLSFLDQVNNSSVNDVDELLSHHTKIGAQMKGFLNDTMPACYILDYTQRKYIYASPRMKELIERPLSYFLDGGVEFAFKLWHKDDLKVYDKNIFPANLNFLKQIPPAEHSSYLFQCNYRGKRNSGGYRQIMQESFFVRSTDTGLPLASIGFLYDISSIMSSNKLIHRIIHIGRDKKGVSQMSVVESGTFFSGRDETSLSKREIEILKYVCEDLTSDEIAQKLFISRHTVDNHRRNLLEKTNCKTSVGLVKFAFGNGYF